MHFKAHKKEYEIQLKSRKLQLHFSQGKVTKSFE